jgi:hypothetical protein
MNTRRGRGPSPIAVALGLVLVASALPPEGTLAASEFAPAPSVLGQTGTFTLNSPELLEPWRTRASVAASVASGNGGNRFDLLASDPGADATVFGVRASLALGLPHDMELAVTIPYLQLDVNDVSTDGAGDLTVSGKLQLRDQDGWMPAAAIVAAWVTETARESAIASVTTEGYLATVSAQLTFVAGRDFVWTMLAEAGGFWRDPGRPESDSSLVYGVAGIVPLLSTGMYLATGELQWLLEISGTESRGDLAGRPDDSLSWASGFRYLRPSGGLTVAGVYTAYQAPQKDQSLGALATVHVAF